MEDNKTVFYANPSAGAAAKTASLLLIDARRSPMMVSLVGNMSVGRERPGSTAKLRVVSEIASTNHGEFYYDEATDSFYYVNYSATNGTYINGKQMISANGQNPAAYRLADGDVLRIDRKMLNEPHPQAVLMVFSRNFKADEKWKSVSLNSAAQITIGRSKNNVIHIGDMTASREHAVIARTDQGMVVYDKKSQNGVFVNAQRINGSAMLYNHDVIRVANTTLVVLDNNILYNKTHIDNMEFLKHI